MPMPRKREPEKRCLMCGVRLNRKLYNARLEDLTRFLQRQFCSRSCANSRSKGSVTRKAYSRRARKFLKPKCEACGATRFRQAHHLNEDWTDNRPENLQTLCAYCHHFWHALHVRLGVKPSRPMPSLAIR